MSSHKYEDVLSATLSLVSKHGFHGTSMSMIAAEANVGAGTIYNYFPGKDDIMRALFAKLKKEFVQNIITGLDPASDLEVQFQIIWRNIIHYYIQFPDQVAYIQQFHYSPYFDQSSLELTNTTLAPVLELVERAMNSGQIKHLPPAIIEAFTLDIATALARRHIKGEIQIDEGVIASTAQMCWAAISSEK